MSYTFWDYSIIHRLLNGVVKVASITIVLRPLHATLHKLLCTIALE